MADEFFLSRWSRRKTLARQGTAAEEKAPTAAAAATLETRPPVAAPEALVPGADGEVASPPAPPEALPPVESLTADSDFTPFMKSGVDPDLRRQALRKLLHDPRFNVMDGLDVYIDDFSKPDPLPPEWLSQMTQMTRLGEYREPEPAEEPQAGEPGDHAAADAAEDPASTADRPGDEPGEPPVGTKVPPPADTSAALDAAPAVDDSSPFTAAS